MPSVSGCRSGKGLAGGEGVRGGAVALLETSSSMGEMSVREPERKGCEGIFGRLAISWIGVTIPCCGLSGTKGEELLADVLINIE